MSSSGAEFTVSWSETLKTLDHGMLMCKWTPCSASLWNTPCIYLNKSHPLRSDNHAKPYCDFIFILLNCSALNNTPLLFTWLEDSFIHSFISIAQTLWDKLFAQSSGWATVSKSVMPWYCRQEDMGGSWGIVGNRWGILCDIKELKKSCCFRNWWMEQMKKMEKAKQTRRNSCFEGAALCMRHIMSSIKTLLAASVSLALSESFVSLWTHEAVWRQYCFSRKRY